MHIIEIIFHNSCALRFHARGMDDFVATLLHKKGQYSSFLANVTYFMMREMNAIPHFYS